MTAFDLIYILAGVFVALEVAAVAGRAWGGMGGVAVFIVTMVAWLLVVRRLISAAVLGLYGFMPVWPSCRVCHARLYYHLERLSDGTRVLRCGCGVEYRMIGVILCELDAGGQLRPYMRKMWWGRWRPIEA